MKLWSAQRHAPQRWSSTITTTIPFQFASCCLVLFRSVCNERSVLFCNVGLLYDGWLSLFLLHCSPLSVSNVLFFIFVCVVVVSSSSSVFGVRSFFVCLSFPHGRETTNGKKVGLELCAKDPRRPLGSLPVRRSVPRPWRGVFRCTQSVSPLRVAFQQQVKRTKSQSNNRTTIYIHLSLFL